MKIVLLKGLHYQGEYFEKGAQVDVDEATYKYIMETTMMDRAQQVQKEAEAKKILDALDEEEINKKEVKK